MRLPYGSLLLAASAGSPSGTTLLFLIGSGLFVSWLLSLWLHPYTACSTCKGRSRHFGAVATRSFRSCTACGGSGKQIRFMAGVLTGDRYR